MSYLLAGGCSFTDDNYKSFLVEHDTGYDKWPTIVAKKLGISRVVNTAVTGGSNDMMIKAVIDNIVDRKPKAVFLMLTSWDRVSVHNYSINYATLIDADYEHKHNVLTTRASHWVVNQENVIKFCNYTLKHTATVKYIINNTLRHLYTLQELCRREDIDLIVAQGLWPIRSYYFNEMYKQKQKEVFDKNILNTTAYAKEMIKSPYFNEINHEQICVGWPYFSELGGWHFEKFMTDPSHFIDQKLDCHPSEISHQMFATMLYNEYRDRYYK